MWDTRPRETRVTQAPSALKDNLPDPMCGVWQTPTRAGKDPREMQYQQTEESRKLRKTGHFQIHLEDGPGGGGQALQGTGTARNKGTRG